MKIPPSNTQPVVYFGLAADFEPSQIIDLLTDDEISKSKSFIEQQDEDLYIIARALLRKVLASQLQLPSQKISIAYSINGKPHLPDYPNLKFNISHTDGAIAIAISSDLNIGVDIEHQDRKFEFHRLEDFLYSESEQTRGEESFLKVWTIKEAIMKAKGIGLSQPLNTIELSTLENGHLIVLTTPWDSRPNWTVNSKIMHEYIISCSVEGTVESIPIINLKWDH